MRMLYGDTEDNKDDIKKDDKKDDTKDDIKKSGVFKDATKILEQVDKEFTVADRYIKPKWDEWLVRLKLYNNQKRDKAAVGDPLLFTIFQTVLASLYSDKLVVEFMGREHGDDEQAENQTILAEYDQEEMRKSELDYEWIWDTLFFGRGLVDIMQFDKKTNTPIPEVIDPLTWRRDPDATSVNGNRKGHGAMRFGGKEVLLSAEDLKNEVYDQGAVAKLIKKGSGTDRTSNVEQNREARRQAQGFDAKLSAADCGNNQNYTVIEWFTFWKGKRFLFCTDKDRGILLRATEIKNKQWPIVDRSIYPIAHDWDGVSIPDLVEDKQRGRSVAQNLALKGIKANLYPNYLFNNLLIKNKGAIANFEFNKFTGVPGNPAGAVVPIERKRIDGDVSWIMNVLDFAAQKATATPDIQQGAQAEKVKSATEIAKISQGVDTRYSLATKIFGWSEKAFWRLWLENYSLYFGNSIDKKIVRLSGVFGPQWRELRRENIIGEADPDILIESKVISDAKRANDVNRLTLAMNQGVALDRNFNKRGALKLLFRAVGLKSDEVNRLLPKTFDEYEAEKENLLLNKNEMPKITMKQNHFAHIETHSKAADTKAKQIHVALHYAALFVQRQNPELAPAAEAAPMTTGETPSPRDMAQSPLQLAQVSQPSLAA